MQACAWAVCYECVCALAPLNRCRARLSLSARLHRRSDATWAHADDGSLGEGAVSAPNYRTVTLLEDEEFDEDGNPRGDEGSVLTPRWRVALPSPLRSSSRAGATRAVRMSPPRAVAEEELRADEGAQGTPARPQFARQVAKRF